jgi:hypothetical protein
MARTHLILVGLVIAAVCASAWIAGCTGPTPTPTPTSSATQTSTSNASQLSAFTGFSIPPEAANGKPNYNGMDPVANDISQQLDAELARIPNVVAHTATLNYKGQMPNGPYVVYRCGWATNSVNQPPGTYAGWVYEIWTSTPKDALTLAQQEVAQFRGQGFADNPPSSVLPPNVQQWNGGRGGYACFVDFDPATCHVTIGLPSYATNPTWTPPA